MTTSSRQADATPDPISSRKTAHLDICTGDDYHVETDDARFGELRFVHNALPELSAGEVDTRTSFLRHTVALPLCISSMTGGSDAGYRLNAELAEVAAETGIPLGMGSIRVLLRHPELADHFRLKQRAPKVPVFANIGAVQLPEFEHERIYELITDLAVDAMAVHFNPAQELAQPEGDIDFTGILDAFSRFCADSPVPVIAKETGFGIRPREALALVHAGARYVDLAGSGGTNWSVVESYRTNGPLQAAARELDEWGAPTAILLAASNTPQLRGTIIASGGVRNGMHVAKSLAMGAAMVGMALPFARAVRDDGVVGGIALVETIAKTLRTVMVLTSSRTVAELAQVELWETEAFRSATAAFASADRKTPIGGRLRAPTAGQERQ